MSDEPGTPRHRRSRGRRGRWVLLGLVLALVAVLVTYNYPHSDEAAKDLPFTVYSADPMTQAIAQEGIAKGSPGTFTFKHVNTRSDLQGAIRRREVVGGLEVTQQGKATLYLASAASPALADGLRTMADRLGEKVGHKVPVVDVVPMSSRDAGGRGLRDGVPWAVAGATVISLLAASRLRRRPLAHLLTALIASMVWGGMVAAVLQSLGSTPSMVPLPLVLVSLVTGALVTGAGMVAGGLGEFLAILVVAAVGIPLSGNTSSPELIIFRLGVLGQALPTGAGVTLLRNAAYFPQVPASHNLSVLLTWLALGLALCAFGLWRHPSHRQAA